MERAGLIADAAGRSSVGADEVDASLAGVAEPFALLLDSFREDAALNRAGHTVDAVPDGLSAEHAVRRNDYDVLVADIVMPGIDGIELARRAGETQPGIRVMFITGFAAVALRAREEAPRDARVLSKPFHLRELVAEIDRMLAA